MAFKALFIAHAPDADYKKHRSVIETGMYKLFSAVVKSQEDAIQVSKKYRKNEAIEAIMLCSGFKHGDVAEIFQALEGKVSVNVSRGEGQITRFLWKF